jgi:tetratricopeptide (TPR) repeat protein
MLSFDTRNGCFIETDNYRAVTEAFDELLEAREGGHIPETRYVAGLKALIEQHPDYLDAHAHLGYALLDLGKAKAALEACERGTAVADSLVPSGYDGLIEWGSLENRPFLRIFHATTLALLAAKQRGRAIALMERLLKWNPDDNQGIRFIIGSELLRDGKITSARVWLERSVDDYPPSRYELGLLHFREKGFAEAATAFRLGFVENGYIAEVLTGMPKPLPLAIWHGSNFAEPDLARDYVNRHGDLWNKTPMAIAFLRWLHTHPRALRERADVMELQQSLLWEDDYKTRGDLLDRLAKASASIDAASSTELVHPVGVSGKRTIYPWMAGEARMLRAEKARSR